MILILSLFLTGCSRYEIDYSAKKIESETVSEQKSSNRTDIVDIAYNNDSLIRVVNDEVYCMFELPLQNYVITSEFGPRWGKLHGGIDLAVPEGTKVTAASSGTIISVNRSSSGYGNCIVISHGEIDGVIYKTRYAHLSAFADIHTGDTVEQGDIIGYSGNTGNSTGPHLHFEIIQNDVQINPQTILEF